jgi:hypothetical protein
MNTTDCVNDVVYRLGFQDLTDLDADGTWVTSNELYAWADEAVKTISYRQGLFVELDASIAVVADTAVYDLPDKHISTLAAWLGVDALRLTPVKVLRALDATWPVTTGPSDRCSLDANSVGTITLYPKPTVGGTLWQLWQEHPPDIGIGASTVTLPTFFQDFLSYRMLAGARAKESDATQIEMAEHFEARCSMYEKIFQHLYS